MVILEFVLNELNAKIPNSVIFSNRKETKMWEKGGKSTVSFRFYF